MGSYSEIANDDYILREVGDADSVTIIGCPYCENQSIAYDKGISIIGESSFGELRSKVYIKTQEADRIKNLLEENGKSADVNIFEFLPWGQCWQNAKDRRAIAKARENSEAAIVLNCFDGCERIKSAFPESFKVIPGMFNVGTIVLSSLSRREELLWITPKLKCTISKT